MPEHNTLDTTTTGDMEREPARTIGDLFADKAMLKTFVTAVATLLAGATGIAIDDATIGAIVTIISGIGLIATPLVAQWEARTRAKEQAERTRQHVTPVTTKKADTRHVPV